MNRKDKLKGIVLSLPTPTNSSYELDLPRLKEHVAWLVDQGLVEGKAVLMAGGGLGGGYFLTREEHGKVMQVLVDAANGKVPTMTGVFDSCTKEAMNKARMARDIGIDFLQINPPHYLPPTDEEVYTHYSMIDGSAEIGIVVYNTPWCTGGYEIKPKLIEQVSRLNNFAGIKWTSFQPVNLINVLKQFANSMTFIDNSQMISLAFQLGVKGYISLLGNIAPKAELYLLGLLERKEYGVFDKEFRRLHAWRDVLGSAEELSYQGAGEATITHGIFDAIGKPMGPPMPPQRKLGATAVQRIKEILVKNKVLETLDKVHNAS